MNRDLADILDDLTANPSHVGITLICQGLAAIATDISLTINTTQVLLAELAGSPDSTDVLAAVGHLVEHLANADTNPALHALPTNRQEEARKHGWTASYLINDPDLRNSASNANAALDVPHPPTVQPPAISPEQRQHLHDRLDATNRWSRNRPT